jgi:hypothetical protein
MRRTKTEVLFQRAGSLAEGYFEGSLASVGIDTDRDIPPLALHVRGIVHYAIMRQTETLGFVPLVLDFQPLTLGIMEQIEVLLDEDKLPVSILWALFAEAKPERDERARVRYSLN